MPGEDEALALGRDGLDDAAEREAATEAARCLERLVRVPQRLAELPPRHRCGPDRRLALVARIDEEVRALVRTAVFSPLAATESSRIACVARDAFGALLDAYQACAVSYRSGEGGHAAVEPDACGYRLVRAAAERIKWERCVGGPAHPGLWPWIANEFRKVADIAGATATARPGPASGTLAGEYLRAVALWTAPLDGLPCEIVEAVDGLIAFALPMIQFQAGGVGGAIYYSPSDFAAPPRRIVRATELPLAAWQLSTRIALKAFEELAPRPDDDPMLLRFARQGGGVPNLRDALRRLIQQWGDAAPRRRFRRHLLDGTLSAVRGIDELRRHFSGEGKASWSEWSLRDASRGGLGVYAPHRADAPMRVGELVGVRSEDGEALQLAVVRRAWIESESTAFVGLETLAQRPALVFADDGRSRTAVFLCDPLLRGEAVRIVAPARALRPEVPLFVTGSGAVQKLKSLDVGLSGEGFELLIYRVL